MSDPVTVSTPEATVSVPTDAKAPGDVEVDSTWLESLFTKLGADLGAALGSVTQGMGSILELQNQQTQVLASLSERLPANLTNLITDQQATIVSLIGQSQETVRSLLTPPQPVVQETPPVVAEVESPVVKTSPEEQTPPKRRRI